MVEPILPELHCQTHDALNPWYLLILLTVWIECTQARFILLVDLQTLLL